MTDRTDKLFHYWRGLFKRVSAKSVFQLWREHGGDQHGPHTETVTMPLANFGKFVDALIEADRKNHL